VPDVAPFVFVWLQRGNVHIFLNAKEGMTDELPKLGRQRIGGTNTMYVLIEAESAADGVDALYPEIQPQARIVMPLKDQFYGMREFGIEIRRSTRCSSRNGRRDTHPTCGRRDRGACRRVAADARPTTPPTEPRNIRGALGVLRRDGLLPFAAFNGDIWQSFWPIDRELGNPVTLDAVPKTRWGTRSPRDWQAWFLKEVNPQAAAGLRLELRAPVMFPYTVAEARDPDDV
jgi:hypothetical protein